MIERRIFLWMGLIVLFFSLGLCGQGFAEVQYKVKKGDTLAKIAKKNGVSVQSLRAANDLNGNALRLKQTLVIPKEGKKLSVKTAKASSAKETCYVVKKGDTIYTVAKKTGVSVSDLKRINHLRAGKVKKGQKLALMVPAPKKETIKTGTTDEFTDTDDDLDELTEDLPPTTLTADLKKEVDESSDLLGTWKSQDERSLFVKVAKGFLGAPYRFGGSSVRGLDCSAFVMKIYQLFDISLPRTAHEQAHMGMRVNRGELQEGDLVFFNTRRAFGHVGIYIGNNQFVHASSGKREKQVKIDSLDKPYYNQRFIKAVRLKDIEKRDGNT
jgi:cell wall-associated NlpC family hydrolase